jgi:hypothetical protein
MRRSASQANPGWWARDAVTTEITKRWFFGRAVPAARSLP